MLTNTTVDESTLEESFVLSALLGSIEEKKRWNLSPQTETTFGAQLS